MAYRRNKQGYYEVPIGTVPSVTKILEVAMSTYALVPWAADLEREMCLRIVESWWDSGPPLDIDVVFDKVRENRNVHKTALKDAGDLGSLVHNMIQAWCEGLYDGDKKSYLSFLKEFYTEQAISMLQAWFDCLEDNNISIIRSEMTVWNPQSGMAGLGGYAGTLDCFGTIGEEKTPCIFDWKTSSAIYDKHWIQTEAYRRAYEFLTKTEPQARAIVRLCKEEKKVGKYEICVRAVGSGKETRRFFDGRKKDYVTKVSDIESDHEIDWQTFLACMMIFKRVNMK